MNKKHIDRLKISAEVECAPVPYQHLPRIFDDYDMNADVMEIKNPNTIAKVMQSINVETDYRYGPSTGYKGVYSYNRDD